MSKKLINKLETLKDSTALAMVEDLVAKYGAMKTMSMLGYVSVAPLYSWRKNKSIPHWAKAKLNAVYKEKKLENNKR